MARILTFSDFKLATWRWEFSKACMHCSALQEIAILLKPGAHLQQLGPCFRDLHWHSRFIIISFVTRDINIHSAVEGAQSHKANKAQYMA